MSKRDSNGHRTPPNTNPNLPDFIHLRYTNSKGELSGQGGITIAYRRTADSEFKYEVAVARCCPTDNFCRKIGRQIASGFLAFNNCFVLNITYNLQIKDSKENQIEFYQIVRNKILEFVTKKFNFLEQKSSLPTTPEGQTLH